MVIVGISVMTMLRFIVALPVALAALTVELYVPLTVGMPVIVPVVSFRLKPVGSVPLDTDHVIGTVPVAMSLWL